MPEKIKDYFRFIKFSHTIFALPFALIGFFLAFISYTASWLLLIYVLLCMIFARSAAMGFNRYLDRKIDAKNPRTSKRELPAGKISSKNALIFVIVSSVLFIVTTLLINTLVFWLSFVALFVVLGYSYTKRFTALSHLVLGLGLSLAPIGAYLAISAEFNIIPVLFSLVVLFWVSGFDVIYSLQDFDFDQSNNLNSIPVMLGKKGALNLSVFLHILAIIPIIILGFIYPFSYLYWIGSSIFIGLLIYQHILVKPDDLSKVNIAFGTTNGVASVIFATFVILDLLIRVL
ncbi:MAG: UbiA family prenyltransferase [Bacteroidales bacterium]|nr:UbiA family prenyltransferase [Bacteroidales bacterium]